MPTVTTVVARVRSGLSLGHARSQARSPASGSAGVGVPVWLARARDARSPASTQAMSAPSSLVRPLQPDVPCFLWQIGSVETRMFTRSRSVPERFTRLQNHLLKFYPADHRVKVVYSSTHPLAAPAILEFQINRMHEHSAEIHPGATLRL